MKSALDNANGRRDDLAKIHMAKKALQWTDDEYRDILQAVCNVRSSSLLDFAGRKRFLAHLQACGWAGKLTPVRSTRPEAWGPRHKRLWAAWQALADARLVQERSKAALQTWVKRQTQVDRIGWLNDQQLDLCINSAKLWLKRGAEPV